MRALLLTAVLVLSGCNLFTDLKPVDSGQNNANTNNTNNSNNLNNSNNSNNLNNLVDMDIPDVGFTTDASFMDASPRVTRDLLLLYTFQEKVGTVVQDRSGREPLVNLTAVGTVPWLPTSNGVRFQDTGNGLVSDAAPSKVYDAVIPNNAFTVELWATTLSGSLSGPARVFSLSQDTGVRNLTIGVQRQEVHVRHQGSMRSYAGSETNGEPYFIARALLDLEKHHWVVTFDGFDLKLFKDGELVYREPRPSTMDIWDRNQLLALGNEITMDRSWDGELYLVAMYSRVLTDNEIQQNFAAGSELTLPE